MKLRGKRVTVMGLGLQGGAVGTVRWLHEQGARVTVTDVKSEQELWPAVQSLRDLSGVRWALGRHDEADFRQTDLVVRNPAVRRESPLLAAARAERVPVEMDSSLFWHACPSRDIIGVTGSKGKTSCSRAVTAVLQALGKRVVEVGTDGISPLSELHRIDAATTVVFELSSWRLEALDERGISPAVAVVTSLFPDHMNTYDSFADYENAKRAIVRHQTAQDLALLNFDDERLRVWERDICGRLYWFSMGERFPPPSPQVRRGQGEVSGGIFTEQGNIIVRGGGFRLPLFQLAEIPFDFDHERRNVLPAILLAHLRGAQPAEIARAVRGLEPLPHRLEKVGEVDEVTYINDSASTVPEATLAALRAYEARTFVLIAGGSDKGLDYAPLAAALAAAHVRALVLLPGAASDKLAAALAQTDFGARSVSWASSMMEAVQRAAAAAQLGDVVLLSPGAASFGLFKHEFDRGDQFRAAVRTLAAS